jgi:hypothetical protein
MRSASSSLTLAAASTLLLVCAGTAASQTAHLPPPAPGSATQISRSTPHLSLTARLDSLAIAEDGRLRMAVDVTPSKGMHVYAPGSAYRTVALRLANRSAFALRAPAQYPKSSLFRFKPLNETVPVYDGPFTLNMDVALARAAGQSAVRDGSTALLNVIFDYQACDDRVCYLPAAVPMRWTIRLLPKSHS